ncbi:hypothetical protein CDV36_015976 [Fusarium kuroshium]|uniref:Uncharacterized protein n=2 Tax=Fusarium solani species complex TaxID=232080 RepID=A0A3M2R3B2_9HYPO|nr:hypothetical protein CDV36_015976 [Fusarium kuroshium]RSL81332.1 hypothetical protein CEP52_017227 [Fusarium oligoseptatum]
MIPRDSPPTRVQDTTLGSVPVPEVSRVLEDAIGLDGVSLSARVVGKGISWANENRKTWYEGSAAKHHKRFYHSLEKQVGPLSHDVAQFIQSSTELNETRSQSVKQMVSMYEQHLRTLNNTENSVRQTLERVNKCETITSQAISSSARSVERIAKAIEGCAEKVVTDFHGVRLVTESIRGSVANLAIHVEALIDELHEVNRNLDGIKDELKKNNILISSGGSGPDGFAGVVHKFVAMHIRQNKSPDDRFFLWHPDTSWHPAFYDLMTGHPLPTSFWGESDDLDKLCISMKAIRQAMRDEGSGAQDAVFHLLIPAWYGINLVMPLHFPDDLLPLRLVGPTHGKALVTFNLPAAQAHLSLDGVDNVLDPHGSNEIAEAAGSLSGFVYGVGGSTAVVMGCCACDPGAILPVFLMMGWGASLVATDGLTGPALAVEEMLQEEPARILGSNERLRMATDD